MEKCVTEQIAVSRFAEVEIQRALPPRTIMCALFSEPEKRVSPSYMTQEIGLYADSSSTRTRRTGHPG